MLEQLSAAWFNESQIQRKLDLQGSSCTNQKKKQFIKRQVKWRFLMHINTQQKQQNHHSTSLLSDQQRKIHRSNKTTVKLTV